jgi:hypothetical protein
VGSWRKILVSVGAVVVFGGGFAVASASSTTTKASQFAACLNTSSATLSKVTVNATPSCPAHSRLVTWNARGSQGPAGTPGAAGARGSLWATGVGAPSPDNTQQSGDLYLDTATGNVYELVAGSWTLEGNVEGPRGSAGASGVPGAAGAMGPAGATGATGPRGSLWTTGVGAPSLHDSQQSGDLYLDTATGNVYELVAGSWTLEENIEGPAGTGYSCSATAFPGVDYDGCNIAGSDFTDQNLLGAQFAGANLADSAFNAGSNFDGANFSGATISDSHLYDSTSFVNANFTGANLTGSYLYNYADFSNADFTGANLTGAYLYSNGVFTNANFTGANLTGALLSEATLSTAVWDDTTCPGGTNSSAYTPQTCVGH